uniref:Uncharacterized protein n=1 Tax=Daphnia magna TaxID=35525 RepID=A0A0P6DGM6_9CRUS
MKNIFRVVLILTLLFSCLKIIPLDWLQCCDVNMSKYSISKSKRLPSIAKNNMGISDANILAETISKSVRFNPIQSKCKFHLNLGQTFITQNVTNFKNMSRKTQMVSHIVDYFLWTNQSSCQISHYFGGLLVSSAAGIVSMDGQKAICLDPIVAPRPYRCIVYSFGINYEWSFDDAMDLYGCKVFSFDPSMNVSNHRRNEKTIFYQMALNDVDKNEWKNNIGIPSRTLSSIYNMLEPIHGQNVIIDYLKIDIESAEWIVLPQILKSGMLDKVRQLSVETHMDFNEDVEMCCEQAKIIHLLEDYGMIRFDSKPNIYSAINLPQRKSLGFEAYEIAWYNYRVSHVDS